MIDTILNTILTGIIAFLLIFLATSFLSYTVSSFTWDFSQDGVTSFMRDVAEALTTEPEETNITKPNFADMTVRQMINYIKENNIRTEVETILKQNFCKRTNINKALKADLYTALLTVD